MARVRIKEKVKSPYINKYVTVVNYMYGDGDGYDDDKYSFNTPEDLSEFAFFIEKCASFNYGYDVGYRIIPGYDEVCKKYGFEDNYSPEAYGEGFGSLDNIEYYYYDSTGSKSVVEIEFTLKEQLEIDSFGNITRTQYREMLDAAIKADREKNKLR